MKVLFIGGTGVISSACSKLAVDRGFELFLLNRGSSSRTAPESAHILNADIRDKESVRKALQLSSQPYSINDIHCRPQRRVK